MWNKQVDCRSPNLQTRALLKAAKFWRYLRVPPPSSYSMSGTQNLYMCWHFPTWVVQCLIPAQVSPQPNLSYVLPEKASYTDSPIVTKYTGTQNRRRQHWSSYPVLHYQRQSEHEQQFRALKDSSHKSFPTTNKCKTAQEFQEVLKNKCGSY